jgi:membrane-bound hydrogenase subunit alpha
VTPGWTALEAVLPLSGAEDSLRLLLEGDRVRSCVLSPGSGHRGIEKLAESKTWDQVLRLLERICGVCPASHSAAAVLAMEEIAGASVPERGQFIRTLVCELERIQSHLLWFGLMGHCLGHRNLWAWAWRHRETVASVFERISGNRVMHDLFKPGGVRRDVPLETLPWIASRLDGLRPAVDLLASVFSDDPVVRLRTRGVGVLDEAAVRKHGAVGPVARASGMALDVRKDDPYFAYPWVDWSLSVARGGDVLAKAEVRLGELTESIGIAGQCLDRMRPGPVSVDVKTVPRGMGIGRVEAPRGELFHCLVSDGTRSPIRVHIRPPSYANLRTNESACPGEDVDDAVLVIAASDPCLGCVDRLVAVSGAGVKNRTLTGADLIRRSQAKTAGMAGDMPAAGGNGRPPSGWTRGSGGDGRCGG